MRFAEDVIVVTGAGSGIGEAMSKGFAAEGGRVAALDIDMEGARATADAIAGADGIAVAIECDVATKSSVDEAVASVIDEFGSITVLCANAGVLDDYAPVLDTTEHEWDQILAINLKAMYLTCYAVLPHMLAAERGAIVTTASIAGLVAGGGGAAYTASKHGVIGFTRQLAFDYGPQGIRANAICPGAIETGMTRELFAAGDAAVMDAVRSVPAGRHGQPEEIARLALFLASSDASFMYGAAVVSDGGWTIR